MSKYTILNRSTLLFVYYGTSLVYYCDLIKTVSARTTACAQSGQIKYIFFSFVSAEYLFVKHLFTLKRNKCINIKYIVNANMEHTLL